MQKILLHYMTKLCKQKAWTIIIFGSLILLFIVWLLSSNKGTSDIESFELYDKFMSPNGFDETNMEKQRQEEYYKSMLLSSNNNKNEYSHHNQTPNNKGNIQVQDEQSGQEEDNQNKQHKQEKEEFIYEDGASKGENECRRVIQKLTGKSFHKIRPYWLKNPVTGNFLELDCYNEDLKLGIEYNGGQHESYIKHFHGSRDAFRNQQYRDYIKNQLCSERGVYLINVSSKLKFKEIEPFIENEYKKYLERETY